MAATGTLQIEMPAMGESVTEGTVLEWHKDEGDFVEEGETIVEVSTDKVDAEVPAPASGTITKLLVEIDDVVKVGQALAELEPGEAATSNGRGPRRAPPSPRPTRRRTATAAGHRRRRRGRRGPRRERPEDSRRSSRAIADPGGRRARRAARRSTYQMPEMGESVTEGTVLEWHKQPGDAVEEGETIVEVSTDKVDAEVPSPAAGTLAEALVELDESVNVGQALARLGRRGGGQRRRATAPRPTARRRRGAAAAGASTPTRRPRRSPGGSPPPRASTSPRQGHGRRRQGDEGRRARRGGGNGAGRERRRPPTARPSRCAGPRGCSPRRWRRAARSRRRPRSGRSPSTPSTPSARRSTAPSPSAG